MGYIGSKRDRGKKTSNLADEFVKMDGRTGSKSDIKKMSYKSKKLWRAIIIYVLKLLFENTLCMYP